ncbi:hypothetical protein [Thermococcus sp. 21S9]|uniref:hypothetical protein n=1 Tax=Thermococcus sp. 21S9 TaxID=1638223 RepID=UPI00143924B5|nr:hypothetical protein [Thermococcus sp. 21S9]NJE54340.1 hypothetical protein [Thermococcus sp. 21S9]
MIMSKGKIFKLIIAVFFVYFFPLFYITESIIWASILATIATSPIVILWGFFNWLRKIKQGNNHRREPYIIGNSTEIEYLTPEDLERKLQSRKKM